MIRTVALNEILSRWRKVLEQNVRQRVTVLGTLFSLALAMVGVAAFLSANNLLFLLLAALIATLLISGLVSRLGLAGLELRVQVPDHIAARRKLAGRVIISNSKLLMPSFSLRLSGEPGSGLASDLYIPVIPAGKSVSEPAEIFFERRGQYRDNAFQLHSRFPFGFTERSARVVLERELVIYPPIDPAPEQERLLAGLLAELESNQRGTGTDFYRHRPYEFLESARHLDWKASAHTGELQVRDFARQEENAVSLFLDLDTNDTEYFEAAVNACAYLLWELSRSGATVSLRSQNFEGSIPENADVYAMLRYLALVTSIQGQSLPPPHADRNSTIAFSARPEAMRAAGWHHARILGPGDLRERADAGDHTDRAGEKLDNRRRKH